MQPLQAALPQFTQPLSGLTTPGTGYWLDILHYYIKDAGLVLGLLLCAAALLWISFGALSKTHAASKGREEWGETLLYLVLGAVVLLLIGFLLDQASTL